MLLLPSSRCLSVVLCFSDRNRSLVLQTEHVAQVIRGVENHKAAYAFLHYVEGYKSVLPGWMGGQRGWRPSCRTGVNIADEVILAGLAGTLAGGSDIQSLGV